jgi:hypothetical protein
MKNKVYTTPTITSEDDKLFFHFNTERIKINNRLLYVSGGISEFLETDKNLPAFREAESRFNEIGFKSIVPHDLISEDEEKIFKWHDFMMRDTPELLKCGICAMLPRWTRSDGAIIEFINAKIHGIPVIDSMTYKPIYLNELQKKELFYKISLILSKMDMNLLNQNL